MLYSIHLIDNLCTFVYDHLNQSMEEMTVMEKGTDISLIGCMREVPDPRAPYSQKHKLLDIIVITITAVLSGMDTWNEIEDWAGSNKEWLGQFLELPGGIPSHDTLNWVFQMIDPEKFHEAFFGGRVLPQVRSAALCPLMEKQYAAAGMGLAARGLSM